MFELRTEWEVLNKSLLDMSKTEVDILIDAANDIYSIEKENLLQSNASGEINSTVYDEKLAQLNASLTVTLEAVRGDFKDSNGYYSKVRAAPSQLPVCAVAERTRAWRLETVCTTPNLLREALSL